MGKTDEWLAIENPQVSSPLYQTTDKISDIDARSLLGCSCRSCSCSYGVSTTFALLGGMAYPLQGCQRPKPTRLLFYGRFSELTYLQAIVCAEEGATSLLIRPMRIMNSWRSLESPAPVCFRHHSIVRVASSFTLNNAHVLYIMTISDSLSQNLLIYFPNRDLTVKIDCFECTWQACCTIGVTARHV